MNMANNNDMPRMNISLSKEEIETLKKLSRIEKRNYSKQISHMMEFYIEGNPDVKKKMEEK